MVAAIHPPAAEIRRVNHLGTSTRHACPGTEIEVKDLSAHPKYLEKALEYWR